MKTCVKCKLEKENSDFHKHRGRCKECYKEQKREYYNRPEIKVRHHNIHKKYKIKFKEKLAKQHKNRCEKDPIYKLTCHIRKKTNSILRNKGFSKLHHLNEYIGCTIEELKIHLESRFYPNSETGELMTWSNHSIYGWHIDHIKPLSLATTVEELYKLCHYTNLQPLWAKENLSKGDKYEEKL